MPYKVYQGELNSPNDNILAKFENVPALRQADVALNQLTGGGPETISARVGREQQASPFAKVIADSLNAIDPGHTERAIANAEMQQKYAPYTGSLAQPEQTASPSQETIGQMLMRVPGRTARVGINGLTGLSSMVADLPFQLANLAGANAKLPSQAQQELMDKYLSKPKGLGEQIPDTIAAMLAGTGDPISRALQAATAAKVPAGWEAAQANARADAAKQLHDAGIVLPPSMAEAGVGSRAVEGIGGSSRTADLAKYINEPKINDLARQALQLPEGTAITKDVLSQQASDLIKTGYDPIKEAGTITTGRIYRQALQDIHDQFSNKSFPELDKQQVLDLLQKVNKKEYDANDAVQIISRLRMEAKDAFKPGGDTQLGKAKLAITKALEDNIELNLQARADNYIKMLQTTGATNVQLKGPNPAELLQNFRDTRIALAKNYAVERMLTDPTTGTVSAIKAAAIGKNTKLTDELALIAQAGSPAFSKATGPATGGKPVPFNMGDAMMMTGGSIAAPFSGGVGSVIASIPVFKNAARHAILSPTMQNMMMRSAGKTSGSIFGGPIGGPASFGVPAQLLPLFGQGDQSNP